MSASTSMAITLEGLVQQASQVKDATDLAGLAQNMAAAAHQQHASMDGATAATAVHDPVLAECIPIDVQDVDPSVVDHFYNDYVQYLYSGHDSSAHDAFGAAAAAGNHAAGTTVTGAADPNMDIFTLMRTPPGNGQGGDVGSGSSGHDAFAALPMPTPPPSGSGDGHNGTWQSTSTSTTTGSDGHGQTTTVADGSHLDHAVVTSHAF
ncbi:hypothetical protein H9P43_004877 [Blastocladiella emersonii ATCC 22665]|nr:hypothetical protein H9P43_004877 [Blastocladiella emersonii ATCC 22665]